MESIIKFAFGVDHMSSPDGRQVGTSVVEQRTTDQVHRHEKGMESMKKLF